MNSKASLDTVIPSECSLTSLVVVRRRATPSGDICFRYLQLGVERRVQPVQFSVARHLVKYLSVRLAMRMRIGCVSRDVRHQGVSLASGQLAINSEFIHIGRH